MNDIRIEKGAYHQTRKGSSAEQPSIFLPLNQTDAFAEKAVLATLIILDKVSFVSPIRWFLPTASDDGTKLVGGLWDCSGETLVNLGGETDADNPTTSQNFADAGTPPAPTPECEENDIRSCGPCDVGFQMCNQDGFWDSVCNYTMDQLSRYCYTGPAATDGIGECRSALQYCSKEGWSACQGEITPHPETCDNKDNDCNGLVDDGPNGDPLKRDFYPGPQGTINVGICRPVAEYCSNGQWLRAGNAEPVLPRAETCNSIDDNCDGTTDESGCGDKIGDACRPGIRDCQSNYCIHPSYYPNGYCTDVMSDYEYTYYPMRECKPGHNFRKAVCVQNSQLGVDTNTWAVRDFNRGNSLQSSDAYYCVTTCNSDSDCRTNEDYTCKTIQGSSYKACLPQHEEVTIGTDVCSN